MKNKNTNKGFTLIEIIVVLVIIAILAAILVPSLYHYIEKAKANSVISEARGIYEAAQTTISDQYATNPNFSDNLNKLGSDGKYYGRVTNNYLYKAQNNLFNDSDINKVDIEIAKEVLKFLESEDKKTASIKFNNILNPLSETVSSYTKKYNQPGIIIVYDGTGKIVFIEYGKDGYLVHIEDGELTTTKDGTFSSYPKD